MELLPTHQILKDGKLDPNKCVFVLDAIAASVVPAEFRRLAKNLPNLELYVYEKLDIEAGFGDIHNAGIDPSKIVRLTRDEMMNLAVPGSFYSFRTNDIIFYAGGGEQQTMVYSCMGRMSFWGD